MLKETLSSLRDTVLSVNTLSYAMVLLHTADQDQKPHGKGNFLSPGSHRFSVRAVAQKDIPKITKVLIVVRYHSQLCQLLIELVKPTSRELLRGTKALWKSRSR